MPENIMIAAFVLGSVMLLISIVGGRFKIFGAEVSGVAGPTGRILAGVVGAILIGIGLYSSLHKSDARRPVAIEQPTIAGKAQLAAEDWYQKGIALWNGSGYSDPNLAIEYFAKAAQLDPVNANTYHSRGIANRQIGLLSAAIEDFSRAISLYPDDAEYYNERGATYWAM